MAPSFLRRSDMTQFFKDFAALLAIVAFISAATLVAGEAPQLFHIHHQEN